MSTPSLFQPLTEDLVSSAFRLSTQAGWNQTEEDWRRLARVNPEGVRVWVDKGEVRASYSVVAYGSRAAWIGMILVDCDYRGGGLGKAMFHASLEAARATGVEVLGLDATDLGEPIYLKFGFQTIAPILRWGGVLQSREGSEAVVRGWDSAILTLDAAHSGMDRSALLADLADSNGTVLRCVREGKTTGYAILRPGRTAHQLGPVAASTAADFSALLSATAFLVAGSPVICDALSPEAAEVLTHHGLQPLRTLKRMTTPIAPGCLCGPGIWCAAGFEWG